jgi:hypothetical protein
LLLWYVGGRQGPNEQVNWSNQLQARLRFLKDHETERSGLNVGNSERDLGGSHCCHRVRRDLRKGIAEVFGTGRDIAGLLTKILENNPSAENPTSKQDKHDCTRSAFTSLDSE